ncbi:hypothetical protein QFC22_001240 [Naganishia vaughanmartiniae]|uniref:Uncharacterized protein n=1 Tax=Naganishia vaughanmartiniae TaxID=1424756 RepID=A0ACC2XHF2_9TREE|nr:hypothetical protein QFC22_001240 [Naganishia vaughanmartiniae]
MNSHHNNRRNKPGPKLSLSGFFSGASGSESAGGRDENVYKADPPTISPAQLKPTRIIDSSPPSNSEVINAFETVPISAVVDRNGTVSPVEEASSSISKGNDSQPALLDPLKHTVVFPLTSSAKQQATQTLLNNLAKDPQATVEIQCARSADPKSGPGGALDDSEWQELSDLVDAVSGFGGQLAEGGAEKDKVDRRIVISGLLAPPLDPSSPSSKLHTSPAYAHTYLPRLTELSLNANVSLMFLPPVVDAVLLAFAGGVQGEEGKRWWRDEDELKRVIRLYGTLYPPRASSLCAIFETAYHMNLAAS